MVAPAFAMDRDMESSSDDTLLMEPLAGRGRSTILSRPATRLALVGIATASAVALVYAGQHAQVPVQSSSWLQEAQQLNDARIARIRALQQMQASFSNMMSQHGGSGAPPAFGDGMSQDGITPPGSMEPMSSISSGSFNDMMSQHGIELPESMGSGTSMSPHDLIGVMSKPGSHGMPSLDNMMSHSTISPSTLLQDETNAASMECKAAVAATNECVMEACSPSCRESYDMVQYTCSGSVHADRAKATLKQCSEADAPPSMVVSQDLGSLDAEGVAGPPGPPEIHMDPQEAMKCIPLMEATMMACDLMSKTPNYEKVCTDDCQNGLKALMADCHKMFPSGDEGTNPFKTLTEECSAGKSGSSGGDCFAAIQKIQPGSPAVKACKINAEGATGTDDVAGCDDACRPALCGILASCPQSGDEPSFMAEMREQVTAATAKCACDA